MKSLERAIAIVCRLQAQHSRVASGAPCGECGKRHPCPTFFLAEKIKAELQGIQKEQGVQ